MTAARRRWFDTVAAFDPPEQVAGDVFADLASRYADERRHYHTLEHVEEVLDWVDRLDDHARDTAAVRLAAWAHDVVYDPQAAGNEAASAEWARATLPRLGVPTGTVEEVARLVEMTSGHEPPAGDRDGEVLADADLAILGADSERYRRYVRDVRLEYAWLGDDRWRSGRVAVLTDLAGRDVLYRTATARSLLDARARANLAWELDVLAGGGTPPQPGRP